MNFLQRHFPPPPDDCKDIDAYNLMNLTLWKMLNTRPNAVTPPIDEETRRYNAKRRRESKEGRQSAKRKLTTQIEKVRKLEKNINDNTRRASETPRLCRELINKYGSVTVFTRHVRMSETHFYNLLNARIVPRKNTFQKLLDAYEED